MAMPETSVGLAVGAGVAEALAGSGVGVAVGLASNAAGVSLGDVAALGRCVGSLLPAEVIRTRSKITSPTMIRSDGAQGGSVGMRRAGG
jgi:hypothetical protein